MKKIVFYCALALSMSSAFAERLQDSVHSVSKGNKKQHHLIFLESGRVVKLSRLEGNLDFYRPGESIELEIDKNNFIKSVSSIAPDQPGLDEKDYDSLQLTNPTILPTYEAASALFSGMNRSWKTKTECTDRAHVWAYEEWKKSGFVSKKVFVFFTNTYIRRYNFNWWFHVSPYTLVGDSSTEYVLDRKYNSSPHSMKAWSETFVKSRKLCPVSTYRHYRANKNGPEHCYLVKSSMYNRLPYHVRMEEDNGRHQSRFNMSEVNVSYRAFNRRGVK